MKRKVSCKENNVVRIERKPHSAVASRRTKVIKIDTRRIATVALLSGVASTLGACVAVETGSSSSDAELSSSTASTSSAPLIVSSSSSAQPVVSSSSSMPSQPQPIEPELVFAVNAGGAATTYDGVDFEADNYFTGGNTYTADNDIANTNEDALFLSERYDTGNAGITYSFPVQDGTYTVFLHFAEIYQDTIGARVFNASIEGQEVLTNFDVFAEAGRFAATTREAVNIPVSDGALDITLTSVTDNAKISGISVYATEVVLSDADKGKEYWEQICASCHARPTDKALVQDNGGNPYNLSALTQIITASMPLGAGVSPSDCVGECADFTAKYLASVNPFYGRLPTIGAPEPQGDIDANPGIMNRLNKLQYNNTVRDLLGDNSNPSDSFPADFTGRFSNIAETLTLSNEYVGKYYEASSKLASQAVQAGSSVLGCNPADQSCRDVVLNNFATKAWRRPLSSEEKSQLSAVYNSANSSTNATTAMTTMLRALLLSPNFIFRPEIDANLNSSQAQNLSAYELATRLSYFLWATMPDDALLAKAANGSLLNDATLKSEVQRMLADSRAQAVIDVFFEEWLQIAYWVKNHPADKNTFPQYTDELENNLVKESVHTLNYIFENNRPVTDLANARYTFLNGPVADFYGIDGYVGNTFRLHQWDEGSRRRGILGQAAVLTGHSHGTKTSPVLRGLWVMDKILCDKPPAPSEGIFDLFPTIEDIPNTRAMSEEHSESNSVCSSCHSYIDPIGYGLESFDAIGQWRDTYSDGTPVNSAAELPTKEPFGGLVDLSNILASKSEMALCSIQWSMSYALGREVDLFSAEVVDPVSGRDYAAVYDVYKKTEDSGHAIKDILTQIALSPAFRQRRGANSQ